MFNPARAFIDKLIGHGCPQAKTTCMTPQNQRVFVDGFLAVVAGDFFVAHTCGLLDIHTPRVGLLTCSTRVTIGNRGVALAGNLFPLDCLDSIEKSIEKTSRVFIGI